jgi:FAD:protein FMN transferase
MAKKIHQQIKFNALGTSWWINFYQQISTKKLLEIEQKLLEIVTNFENNYSRFKPNSKLSILNKQRFFFDPELEFIEMIQIGLDYFNQTRGVFNIGLGKLLSDSGYDSNYSFKPKNLKQIKFIPNLNQQIVLESDRIKLLGKGWELDFGGLGKGFLIDKLFICLRNDLGVKRFLINGGGDIRVCGSNHELWLQNPFSLDQALFQIRLNDGESLGVSSNQIRQWGKCDEFGHILNPLDINLKSEIASFVIAQTALEADIYSTIYCIDYQAQINSNLEFITLDKQMNCKGFNDFLDRVTD